LHIYILQQKEDKCKYLAGMASPPRGFGAGRQWGFQPSGEWLKRRRTGGKVRPVGNAVPKKASPWWGSSRRRSRYVMRGASGQLFLPKSEDERLFRQLRNADEPVHFEVPLIRHSSAFASNATFPTGGKADVPFRGYYKKTLLTHSNKCAIILLYQYYSYLIWIILIWIILI
jgi:hypothetical protein